MIEHQRQPSANSCGQTCVAMLLGIPAQRVIDVIPDKRGTVARQLCDYLEKRGWHTTGRALPVRSPMPCLSRTQSALCRVRWGAETRRAHWVLLTDGQWFDPLVKGEPLFRKGSGRVLSAIMMWPGEGWLKKMIGWPDDEPPRYNACTDPCDMWMGPCACGAWHRGGR